MIIQLYPIMIYQDISTISHSFPQQNPQNFPRTSPERGRLQAVPREACDPWPQGRALCGDPRWPHRALPGSGHQGRTNESGGLYQGRRICSHGKWGFYHGKL